MHPGNTPGATAATLAALALALAALAGCSDEPDPAKATADLERFCDTIAEQRCKGRSACCEGAAAASEAAACRSKERAACAKATDPVAPGVEAKTVRVDDARLAACVADLATAAAACDLPATTTVAVSCGAVLVEAATLGAPCQAGVEGLACADGQGRCRQSGKGLQCVVFTTDAIACSSDLACADGLRCLPGQPGLGPNTAIPGSCGAPRGPGAACSDHGHCAEGSRCASDGRCEAGAALGQPCTLPVDCGPGLVCDTDHAVCIAQVPVGTACLGNPHCVAGARCVGKRLVGVCGAAASAGQPCEQTAECAAGLRCDPALAACMPALPVGAPCPGPGSCGAEMGCDATTWTCKALPAAGAPCLMGIEPCAAGLVCLDFQKGKGTCQPPGTAGSDCVKHANCAAGFGCDFAKPGPSGKGGSCVVAPANGSPCLDSFICAQGYCDHAGANSGGSGGAAQPVCHAFAALGGECPGGHECGPGRACVADSAGTLRCVATPALGEPCLFSCVDGAVCRRSIEPGVCVAAICAQ